jgi:hypothetical protein
MIMLCISCVALFYVLFFYTIVKLHGNKNLHVSHLQFE